MNIAQLFEKELGNSHPGAGAVLSVAAAPRCLNCHIHRCDALAVSFAELRLTTSELANAGVTDLQRLSQSIGKRVTYLLEPIAPIESDDDQCVVQMRSNPPQLDDDGRSYYELLVRRGGEMNLVRYRKESGNVRLKVPATVTKEVILRLIRDFDAALDDFAAAGR